MNELRILEEIRDEFVGKFENDPQVKRICNVMINEFKARKQALTLTDVGNCPFEAYAVFCIECDRKGIKPIKHKDYLNLG
tara:strand:+ start:339 stop:578 length:240 start_codon:yes stop_codon:yes gene_type:complete